MKIIKFVAFAFISLLIFGGAWFYSMTSGEIWLVLNKKIARDYASALLKIGIKPGRLGWSEEWNL